MCWTRAGLMRRMALACGLIALTGLCAPQPLLGQDTSSDDVRFRLGLGLLGGGATNLNVELGGAAQLTVNQGPHQGTLRLTLLGSAPSGQYNDELTNFAVLYGRSAASSRGFASISAGPGVVSARGRGGSGSSTVGVTALAEAGLHAKVVGISLQAVGGLSSAASFVGLGIMLSVGRMG
jgi:hypothetical protein